MPTRAGFLSSFTAEENPDSPTSAWAGSGYVRLLITDLQKPCAARRSQEDLSTPGQTLCLLPTPGPQPGLHTTQYPERGLSRAPEAGCWCGEQGRGCLILRCSGPKPRAFPLLRFCLLAVLMSRSPATPQLQRGPQVPKALRQEASFPTRGVEGGENPIGLFSLGHPLA